MLSERKNTVPSINVFSYYVKEFIVHICRHQFTKLISSVRSIMVFQTDIICCRKIQKH